MAQAFIPSRVSPKRFEARKDTAAKLRRDCLSGDTLGNNNKIMSTQLLPTIIFQDGATHEVSASILFANLTSFLISNIAVCRYDLASWDNVVDAGFVNKKFDQVQPNNYLIIDELSSFDLEFKSNYKVNFQIGESQKEITFDLNKYGKFEAVEENVKFKTLGVDGSIIKVHG